MCTTELGTVAGLQSEFAKRNCKVLGISVDGVSDHERWSQDIEASQGHALNYPLESATRSCKVVKAYDMLPADAGDTSVGTHTGRQRHRALGLRDRAGQAHQGDADLPDEHRAQLRRDPAAASTRASSPRRRRWRRPANWNQGEDVIILPAVSDAEAREKYPDGWQAPLPYIRIVPQPK